MGAWWAIIIFLATGLGAAPLPLPANKPVTRDDILYLLNNYVPSNSVTSMVKENGIDFDPDEAYLKKVRAAGGKEDLLAALRDAHGGGPRPVTVHRSEEDSQAEEHLSRALELEKLQSYPEAEQAYRAAIAIQPRNSTLHVGLARDLSKQEKWNAALVEYREAIRLDPQSAEAHGALGLAISLRGDPAAAIR